MKFTTIAVNVHPANQTKKKPTHMMDTKKITLRLELYD